MPLWYVMQNATVRLLDRHHATTLFGRFPVSWHEIMFDLYPLFGTSSMKWFVNDDKDLYEKGIQGLPRNGTPDGENSKILGWPPRWVRSVLSTKWNFRFQCLRMSTGSRIPHCITLPLRTGKPNLQKSHQHRHCLLYIGTRHKFKTNALLSSLFKGSTGTTGDHSVNSTAFLVPGLIHL